MEINLEQVHRSVDQLYLTPSSIPAYTLGKSIVTSVYGGELASGYVLMRELIRLGVTLPIEIFHRAGELNDQQISVLTGIAPEQIAVKQIQGDAKDFTTIYGNKAGWSSKIYALYESSYAENLWIDSDNFPITNPEFLFDDPEYISKHCLFWRDVFSTDRANRYHDQAPIWPVFNVQPNDGEPFEAGQLLINKPLCWAQFRLVKHYADNCDVYYHFGGDTETFRMAWQHHSLRNGGYHQYLNYHASPSVPYGFMPYGPFHKGVINQYGKWGGGSVMVQRDRSGKELFNHRNLNKMSLGANVYNDDIANEARYHEHVAELKKTLENKNG